MENLENIVEAKKRQEKLELMNWIEYKIIQYVSREIEKIYKHEEEKEWNYQEMIGN